MIKEIVENFVKLLSSQLNNYMNTIKYVKLIVSNLRFLTLVVLKVTLN